MSARKCGIRADETLPVTKWVMWWRQDECLQRRQRWWIVCCRWGVGRGFVSDSVVMREDAALLVARMCVSVVDRMVTCNLGDWKGPGQ